jgi:ribonuclease P protein component
LTEDRAAREGKPSFRFRRRERLKKRDEIGAVFKRGKAVSCPGAKLFVLVNGRPHNRIAVTFSRKFGGAVERNRARRISREAYRHLSPGLRPGYDLVLLVYPAPAGGAEPEREGFPRRMNQLGALFSRVGLRDGLK